MQEENTIRSGTFVPLVSVITFTGFLDSHLLIPIIALFTSELGVGVGMVGLIVGLYSLVNTPANIVFGRVVDRVGFKPLLIIGLIADAIAMFLYAITSLPWHLVIVRLFHGLAGGMVGPATMSAMMRPETGKSHAGTMAAYGTALAVATLVGYAVGGTLASHYGYDSVFFLGGGLLIAGLFLSLLLPSYRPLPRPVSPDAGNTWAITRRLLVRRDLIAPYSTVFAQYFSLGGVVTLLPLYIRDLGLDAFHTGMAMAVFSVMFIVTQLPVAKQGTRIRGVSLAVPGIVLAIAALLLLPAVMSFALIAVCLGLYGIAHGMMFPSISAMVAENTAPEERGLGTGIFHALLTGGVAVGAPVMGWLGGTVGLGWGLAASPIMLVIALAAVLVTTGVQHRH